MSGRAVMEALDPKKYDVLPIGIDRQGRWLLDDPMARLTANQSAGGQSILSTVAGQADQLEHLDIVFPVLHGPYGEDGSIQGLLQTFGVPYVGAEVAGSAVGMDKALMKALFAQAGIPVVPYRLILRSRFEADAGQVCDALLDELELPVFVKPANLGSSVGISRVDEAGKLRAALELAARYDRRLLVEQGVDAREIECAVLGNDEPEASIPGEIVHGASFYDYTAKYNDPETSLVIPAAIPNELSERVRSLSIEAFQALDTAGLARVDFLVSRGADDLCISELNTMPGFTVHSMYPKLWAASGIGFGDLVDRLIQLGLDRANDRRRNRLSPEEQS